MAVYPFCKMDQSELKLQTVMKMRKNLLLFKFVYLWKRNNMLVFYHYYYKNIL